MGTSGGPLKFVLSLDEWVKQIMGPTHILSESWPPPHSHTSGWRVVKKLLRKKWVSPFHQVTRCPLEPTTTCRPSTSIVCLSRYCRIRQAPTKPGTHTMRNLDKICHGSANPACNLPQACHPSQQARNPSPKVAKKTEIQPSSPDYSIIKPGCGNYGTNQWKQTKKKQDGLHIYIEHSIAQHNISIWSV